MTYPAPAKIPTPPPSPSGAQVPPAKLDHTDTAKIRLAAYHATRVYPGAAGRILAQHLLDFESFGWRFDRSRDTAELVRDVLAQLPPR